MRAPAVRSIMVGCCLGASIAFQQRHHASPGRPYVTPRAPPSHGGRRRPRVATDATSLRDMKRPILDTLATLMFKLENDRVAKSSVPDEKGRSGEPMEWAEEGSIANRFSQFVSSNDIGYKFKQAVADIVAGEYDREARTGSIRSFVSGTPVAMYSFTTCPFCRKAKDYLEEQSIPYESIELDLLPGNEGNEIRAELGRMTRRTSVPSIFIGGKYIGGCNDGPGLLPLSRENKLDNLLKSAGVKRG